MNFAQTELLIHVVNRETNRILDVDRWVGSVLRLRVCLPALEWGGDPPKGAQTTPSGLRCGALPQRWAGLVERTVWKYEQSSTRLPYSPHRKMRDYTDCEIKRVLYEGRVAL